MKSRKFSLLVAFFLLVVVMVVGCKDDVTKPEEKPSLVGEWYAYNFFYTIIGIDNDIITHELIVITDCPNDCPKFKVVFTDETITTPYFDNYKYEVRENSIVVFPPNEDSVEIFPPCCVPFGLSYDKLFFKGKDTLVMREMFPDMRQHLRNGQVALIRIKE